MELNKRGKEDVKEKEKWNHQRKGGKQGNIKNK